MSDLNCSNGQFSHNAPASSWTECLILMNVNTMIVCGGVF